MIIYEPDRINIKPCYSANDDIANYYIHYKLKNVNKTTTIEEFNAKNSKDIRCKKYKNR